MIDIIYNASAAFISKWWSAFFLTFILAAMLMGNLNIVTGYAVILLLLICQALQLLRRIVKALEVKAVIKEGPWT